MHNYLLAFSFIASLFFCSFDTSFSIARTVFPVLLWILILTSGSAFKSYFKDLKSSPAFIIILIFFTAFHGLSLFYTANSSYGFSKFYGIIFNLVLNILALRFIIVNFSEDILKKIVEVVLYSATVLTIISMIMGPFVSFYDENLQMRFMGINLWSHVGFGRYMGFAFIVSLINIFYIGYLRKFQLDKFFLLITFAGLILSGLRSAITCSLIISAVIVIYSLKKKNVSLGKIFLYIGGGIIILLIAAYFNNSFSILFNRYSQVLNIFHQKDLNDGAISTRLHIYRYSFELFLQNVFLGRGLGSFYDETLYLYTRGLKYPHNIIIEYAIELGTLGLIFIISLLIYLFKKAQSINTILSFVFLYFLLLSMFSYSIPFQAGLFAFISFVGFKKTYQSPA